MLFCYGGVLEKSEGIGKSTMKNVYGWRTAESKEEAIGNIVQYLLGEYNGWLICTIDATEIPNTIIIGD